MDMNNYSIENLLGFKINRAAIAFRKKLSARFAESAIDLTPEEFAVLSRLWEEDGILQNHLVEKTLKDKTRVTRLLNGLKNKELIYKEINENDKRKQFVFLTRKGHDLQGLIQPMVIELMRAASSEIPTADLTITLNTLDKIFMNLNDK